MLRFAEIVFETGVIVYDALFLALAGKPHFDTVVVTADSKLLEALEDTAYARFAYPLADLGSLIP